MAYPEPTPEIRGRDAREFIRRLEGFDLTDEQLALYRDCRDFYRMKKPGDRAGK